MSENTPFEILTKLKYNADGLIPAIVQQHDTGRVLMMAWMNEASLRSTIETGKTHFWSRSRQKYWMKGESSGHTQAVKQISFDCDGDTLLIQVEQTGAACHEGYQSCFFRAMDDKQGITITEPQLQKPEEIYGSSKS
jgi:phosphoribosyl-AMP cyclohydrolase